MLALLIETCSEKSMVAITHGLRLLSHREFPFGHQQSKHLLPAIQEALTQTRLTLAELSFIAMGRGPGSYTGIRMGASVAKTLSFALEIPLVGVNTLHTFCADQEGAFAVMLDARISGVYLVVGQRIGGKVCYREAPKVCSIEEASKMLQGVQVVLTPNKRRLETLWKNPHWKWLETGPNPLFMAQQAEELYERGEFSKDGSVELLYLRKTQAEIEKEKLFS